MTERFVCSTASIERGEPITATASQVRAWLLIEVHGSWGIDAVSDSHLGAHVPDGWKADLVRRGIRPICIRPSVGGEEPDELRVFFVHAARPDRNPGRAWTKTVPSLGGVRYLSADLDPATEPTGWTEHRDRIVLVCTNGKHDQCCATRGRPVVRHLRSTRWADQTWECSHVGGDRFAANVVVLPDSLYFGRMSPAEAETLLDDHADGRIDLQWFRGRSSLRFAEQAAEHAIRTRFDVTGVDDVVMSCGPDGGLRAHVAGVGTFDVDLERTVEHLDGALTCRGPAGQDIPHHELAGLRPVDD